MDLTKREMAELWAPALQEMCISLAHLGLEITTRDVVVDDKPRSALGLNFIDVPVSFKEARSHFEEFRQKLSAVGAVLYRVAKDPQTARAAAQLPLWLQFTISSALYIRDGEPEDWVAFGDEIIRVSQERLDLAHGNRPDNEPITTESLRVLFESVMLWALREIKSPEVLP